MSSDLHPIEHALDALLRAAIDDDLRMVELQPVGQLKAWPVDLSGPVPTRAQTDIKALIKQPVGAACREAIRRLGQHLFDLARSVDTMRDVLERVAELDAAHVGRRLTIGDNAWNGIGNENERWWS